MWDGIKEFSSGARPAVSAVRVLSSNDELTAVTVEGSGISWLFFVTNGPSDEQREHTYLHKGTRYSWKGNSYLIKLER